MTLLEAVQTANRSCNKEQPEQTVRLVCGFTPLHLQTFLLAHLVNRFPDRRSDVEPSLFGDLVGSLRRAANKTPAATAIVVEWADLDPRLGLRTGGGWKPDQLTSILEEASAAIERMLSALGLLAAAAPAVVCGPTLPLPPVCYYPSTRSSHFTARLNELVAGFLAAASQLPGVHLVSRQTLDERSPLAGRLDLPLDLKTGFPYRLPHADVLAGLLVECLFPLPPKKAVITDLDCTLWSNILGEAGVSGVHWGLEHHSQIHGLYQQVLASLAATGVLIAVASKNDPDLVAEALKRPDLLLDPACLFPVEANWGPKSASVERILKAWNIGEDSVVFIDDSPMELDEVKAAYPGIECVLFPTEKPAQIWDFLWELRDRFGRSAVGEEDQLRVSSLRANQELLRSARREAPAEFLARLDGTVSIDYEVDTADTRAFELVNKTNQFNLNGYRYTETQWAGMLLSPDSFLARASYRDKFGALGKIAIAAGTRNATHLRLDCWVMSCRAFSRNIEHHVLDSLFRQFGVDAIDFKFQPTERNGPLREFFESLPTRLSESGNIVLHQADFRRENPLLPHRTEEGPVR